jgi:hypothetical protein
MTSCLIIPDILFAAVLSGREHAYLTYCFSKNVYRVRSICMPTTVPRRLCEILVLCV